jgi:hypothetical protein
VDGYAYDSEREQKKPDERVGYQRQQSQGPAEYEQDAPEEESEHDLAPFFSFYLDFTSNDGRKFHATGLIPGR